LFKRGFEEGGRGAWLDEEVSYLPLFRKGLREKEARSEGEEGGRRVPRGKWGRTLTHG